MGSPPWADAAANAYWKTSQTNNFPNRKALLRSLLQRRSHNTWLRRCRNRCLNRPLQTRPHHVATPPSQPRYKARVNTATPFVRPRGKTTPTPTAAGSKSGAVTESRQTDLLPTTSLISHVMVVPASLSILLRVNEASAQRCCWLDQVKFEPAAV